MKTSQIIKWYFVITLLVWWVLVAAYGGGHTEVRQSPMYNTPEQETRIAFVHFPIFAILWPVWAGILYGLLEWLPTHLLRMFKKQG
ncbi:MAG: hypothetical protein Q7S86_03375 [bacterium]|nr:hypothetical protein [bacterium]